MISAEDREAILLIALAEKDTRIERLEKALLSLVEGNLGDQPWQAGYQRIREVAQEALKR